MNELIESQYTGERDDTVAAFLAARMMAGDAGMDGAE